MFTEDILLNNQKSVIACDDNIDFISKIKDESQELIVTSPPYNIGKEYEKNKKQSMSEYIERQTLVIKKCVAKLSPTGSICWQVGNHVKNGEIFPLDIILYHIFKEEGLYLRNRIIWHFEHGLNCKKRLSGRHETILWFTKSDEYTFNLDPIRVPSKYPNKRYYKGKNAGKISSNPLGKNPGDVWIFPNVKHNHVEKTIHPCQFPVELVERLVLSLTNPGDSVFDPYMGVGSSIIAALKHGRAGYGCDIVKEYVEVAQSRIDDLKSGKLLTRPMNKPVYDPSLPKGGHQ